MWKFFNSIQNCRDFDHNMNRDEMSSKIGSHTRQINGTTLNILGAAFVHHEIESN